MLVDYSDSEEQLPPSKFPPIEPIPKKKVKLPPQELKTQIPTDFLKGTNNVMQTEKIKLPLQSGKVFVPP